MKTFLACAGTNGSEMALQKMVEAIKRMAPDAVLFAGGITDPDSPPARKVEFMAKFFESLGKNSKFAAVVPGPYDTPLREFLRAALITEPAFPISN